MSSISYPLDRAIVIGASMSGMLAARVLAGHFREVVVIERDDLPEANEPRKSVPQGKHAHALLARGRELLEEFFPGLTQELAEQGALIGDLTAQGIWFSGGVYTGGFPSELVSIQVSRPLLERTIRKRLCAITNVTILDNHDVVGLVDTPGSGGKGKRISGVRVVDRTRGVQSEKTMEASLVVDAGGRGSRVTVWLEGLGYARPEEEHIKINLSYTTRVFHRLPDHAGGHSPVVVFPSPGSRRGGSMLAMEGDRWIVTLAGFLGEEAPASLDGFVEFARSLDAPDIYNVVKGAEPIGEASKYKYPSSQRRHYEKLTRFPQGLLVFGDALCSFNPVYGQGMTTAAIEANLLDQCLRAGLPGVATRFFRRASRLLDSPWLISAGSDLALPEVEGRRFPAFRLTSYYFGQYGQAAQKDPVLAVVFFKVANLIEPPSTMFRPDLALRVLWDNLVK